MIPVFKNMDPYDMPKEFAKLQAQDIGKIGAMQDLLRGVGKIMGRRKEEPTAQIVQQTVIQAGTTQEILLKRGFMSLEDAQWDKAKELFDKVLNNNPENADAYLGLAMTDAQAKDRETLRRKYIQANSSLRGNRNLARASQFKSEWKSWLEQMDWEGAQADRLYQQLHQCNVLFELLDSWNPLAPANGTRYSISIFNAQDGTLKESLSIVCNQGVVRKTIVLPFGNYRCIIKFEASSNQTVFQLPISTQEVVVTITRKWTPTVTIRNK